MALTPLPWSFSSYQDFVNCPRAFSEKRVFKTVKETQSEAMIWGDYVHKQFEAWQIAGGGVLPDTLREHEPFMRDLKGQPGEHYTELRYALDRTLTPCEFFSAIVWHRGVIDWHSIAHQFARIVDYKTGKPHNKPSQLILNALWIFAKYRDVKEILSQYYWTRSQSTTDERYRRADIPAMWAHFAPNLSQYVEAFHTDTWQPRPSGLCGWCPVTSCEHWKPNRRK